VNASPVRLAVILCKPLSVIAEIGSRAENVLKQFLRLAGIPQDPQTDAEN